MKIKSILLVFFLVMSICQAFAAEKEASVDSHPSAAQIYQRKKSYNIVIEDLSLYKVLQGIELLIDINEQEATAADQQIHDNVVKFIQESKELFNNIVDGFNTGCLSKNPEIKYKFVNLCNHFNGLENIKPRHLRAFSIQMEKFNRVITEYCLKRKDSLTFDDLSLFNQIIRFNQQLAMCLEAEELFRIDLWDDAVDFTIYRPWEFVCSHKLLVGATLLVIGGLITYFYILPKIEEQRRFKNLNTIFDVKQFRVPTQSGLTCSFHALHNQLVFSEGGSEEEIEKLINDKNLLKERLTAWTTWRRSQKLGEALDEQSLQELIAKFKLDEEHRIVLIPAQDALRNVCDLDFLAQWRALEFHLDNIGEDRNRLAFLRNQENLNTYQLSEQWADLVAVAGQDNINFLTQEDGQQNLAAFQQAGGLEFVANGGLCERYQAFRNNKEPFGILLNTASNDRAMRSADGGRRGVAHWVTAFFVPDETAKNGVHIRVADSMNSNYTAHPAITRIAELLTKKK
ncbi:hypothetical protein K2X40_05410 [Candidatus Babeliales bacterium]|nr:hypothetical protein [Candidatus Babeliales bacterium]